MEKEDRLVHQDTYKIAFPFLKDVYIPHIDKFYITPFLQENPSLKVDIWAPKPEETSAAYRSGIPGASSASTKHVHMLGYVPENYALDKRRIRTEEEYFLFAEYYQQLFVANLSDDQLMALSKLATQIYDDALTVENIWYPKNNPAGQRKLIERGKYPNVKTIAVLYRLYPSRAKFY